MRAYDETYLAGAQRRLGTMLDVAVRGIGNKWNDVIIPGMDYVLVEKTLGKFGNEDFIVYHVL